METLEGHLELIFEDASRYRDDLVVVLVLQLVVDGLDQPLVLPLDD